MNQPIGRNPDDGAPSARNPKHTTDREGEKPPGHVSSPDTQDRHRQGTHTDPLDEGDGRRADGDPAGESLCRHRARHADQHRARRTLRRVRRRHQGVPARHRRGRPLPRNVPGLSGRAEVLPQRRRRTGAANGDPPLLEGGRAVREDSLRAPPAPDLQPLLCRPGLLPGRRVPDRLERHLLSGRRPPGHRLRESSAHGLPRRPGGSRTKTRPARPGRPGPLADDPLRQGGGDRDGSGGRDRQALRGQGAESSPVRKAVLPGQRNS